MPRMPQLTVPPTAAAAPATDDYHERRRACWSAAGSGGLVANSQDGSSCWATSPFVVAIEWWGRTEAARLFPRDA